ncbi:MAG TPA: DNA recombination protein RmuC [Phycisphaerales bacterium]|nr:DNA recombination protein RmuC [Phycisphaerales bacterium]
MEIMAIVLGIGVVVIGLLAAWLGLRLGRVGGELSATKAEADRLRAETGELARAVEHERALADESAERVRTQAEELARLRERLENTQKLQQELDKNEHRLKEAFTAISAEALKAGRMEFLEQAKPVFDAARQKQESLVKPIGEVLQATREKLETIERARAESFARLHEKIDLVSGVSSELRTETAKLTKALSKPEVRGQYGEIQLRRVAELAGMTRYCDYSEQTSVRADDGSLLRPDMVVRLPNDRVIVVDAKTNIYAYIEAVNATDDDERERHLDRFARHVMDQAKKLSDKAYWARFDGSPEFVVMFVPGDNFIDAALARKPELLEFAAEKNIILASPSTLIGLLRAVAVGWREERLAEEARGLLELGRELHERAVVAFTHAGDLGKSLRQSVDRYNKLVGSIDSRLVPTLKKFEDVNVKSAKPLPTVAQVEVQPKQLETALSDRPESRG